MLLGGFLANFNRQVPFFGYGVAFLILPSALLALTDSLPKTTPAEATGPNQSSWILSLVEAERRGFGVGLVTTAMFLGRLLVPVLVELLINPDDPAAVWRRVSVILLVHVVLYFLLSKIRGLQLRRSKLAFIS